jgi:hypothetical protein
MEVQLYDIARYQLDTDPSPWFVNAYAGSAPCVVPSCDRSPDAELIVRKKEFLLCSTHFSELTQIRKQLRGQ